MANSSQYGSTISSWLLHAADRRQDGKNLEAYEENLCFYTVLSYVLGIGDRHLNNVMITGDGRIFHIDFSFLFGSNPKPMSKYVVFTKDMLQATKDPEYFINQCVDKFLIIRCRIDEFMPLLYLIETRDKLADFFRSQLFLDLSSEEAGIKFKERLKQSVYSILGNLFNQGISTTKESSTSLVSSLLSWK